MSFVSTQDISWAVDGVPIVQDVSLGIEAGEFIGLVGPNGSGKSTLLRTIYRVLKPTGGAVFIDGNEVWKTDAREVARQCAVVTQERASDFEFTVEEVVIMGRIPHKGMLDADTKADHEIVRRSLAEMHILDFAHRSFSSLSGGEKQRVLMARALAQQARFLVLDEPTNHLDIRHQLDLLERVRRLKVTTLAALHDLNLAAQYCHRIIVMRAGRIVASGAPREVLQPDLLREVYGVEAEINADRSGRLRIDFSYLGA